MSLSARRAWIEISVAFVFGFGAKVALRKESVDRNSLQPELRTYLDNVALRKESVDRNSSGTYHPHFHVVVALRKESVDRNKAQVGKLLN